jgi:hypothetical protein
MPIFTSTPTGVASMMAKGWTVDTIANLAMPKPLSQFMHLGCIGVGLMTLLSSSAQGQTNSTSSPDTLLPPQSSEIKKLGRVTPVWQLEQAEPDVTVKTQPERQSNETPAFQPITRLRGEAVFAFIYATGDRSPEASFHPNFGSRLRLDLETSFTGEDQLRLRLQSTNVARLDDVFDTDRARLAIQGEDQGQVELSRLDYQFPLGDRTDLIIPIVGGSISDIADPLNPLLSSSGQGSLSRFGQRNPLYRQGGGTGLGIRHQVSDRLNLSWGYLSEAQNLLPDQNTVAFTQLTLAPTNTVSLGLLYIYAFNGLDTGTGSQLASDPFDSDAISSHSVGLQASANITPQLVLSGWAGWTRAIATDLPHTPEADILNWAVILGYQDLLGEGNQAALVIGSPPEILNNATPAPLHVELSYKIQMNEHISVTPGLIIVTHPEEGAPASMITGVIRTTFRF